MSERRDADEQQARAENVDQHIEKDQLIISDSGAMEQDFRAEGVPKRGAGPLAFRLQKKGAPGEQDGGSQIGQEKPACGLGEHCDQ